MTTHYRTELKGYKYGRILLLKYYFEVGYSRSNYFFKIVAVFGLTTQLAKATFWVLGAYSIFCYFLGRWWCKHKLIDTENEIGNIFNPFQREVRNAIKKERFK